MSEYIQQIDGSVDPVTPCKDCGVTSPAEHHPDCPKTEPTKQPTAREVVKFWDGQKYRFCPSCQAMAFEFAEDYSSHVLTGRK